MPNEFKVKNGIITPTLQSTASTNLATSSGNVGIGTTSVTAIYGRTLQIGSGSTESSLSLLGSTGNGFVATTGATFGVFGRGSMALVLGSNDVERARIDTSGNVGIGTSSPAAKLDVVGSLGIRVNEDAAGTKVIQIRSNYAGLGPSIQVSTADPLLFLTSNTERMRITSTGTVGIGTSSPAGTLHVYGSGTTQAVLTSGDQTTTYLRFINTTNNAGYVGYTSDNLIFLTGSSERMRLDASGNLLLGLSGALANGTLQIAGGIGLSGNTQIRQATSSDGSTLQVFATQFVAGSFNSTSYSYAGGGLIASVSPGDSAVLLDTGRATPTDGRFKVLNTTSANTALSLEKNGVYTLYSDTGSGNLGIGTSSPAQKLDIVGSGLTIAKIKGGSGTNQGSAFYIEQAGSTSTLFAIGDSASIVGGTPDTSVRLWTAASVPLIMNVGSVERMRITAAGDVGIGTSSPSVKFEVSDATTGELRVTNSSQGFQIYTQNGATTLGTYTVIPLILRTNATEAMRIDVAGNVGIGTSLPLSRLTVSAANTASGSEQLNITDTTTNNRLRLGYNTATNLGVIEALTAGVSYRDIVINPNGGNLGLGVTPSAWFSGIRALDISNGALASSGNTTQISHNAFFDVSGFKYKTNGFAAEYRVNQGNGSHAWFTAPSGTAGNAISFSQIMALDASGNLENDGNYRVVGAGNQRSIGFKMYGVDQYNLFVDGVTDAARMTIRRGTTDVAVFTAAGDVGIGTSSPAAKLQITATGGVYNAAVSIATDIGGGVLVRSTSSGANSRVGLFLQGSDQIGAAIASAREDTSATWKTYLSFYTNNLTGGNVLSLQEKMRLDSAGNLGVGTSSPSAKLTLKAASNVAALRIVQDNNENYGYSLQANSSNGNFQLNRYSLGSDTSAFVTVDTSGNLGLGVTPSAWGSGIKSQQIGNYTALTNNQGGYTWLSNNAFYDTAWKYLTTNRALYYAQDTADGGHKWFTAPSGTAGNAISFTQSMVLDASSNLAVTGDCSAVNFNSTSDANKKEDIETIINSIELIMRMRGVSFKWKDTKAKSIGLIAQEVEEIIPEVVVTTNGIKTISYGNLIGLLIEGFKNHEDRLTALESVTRAM